MVSVVELVFVLVATKVQHLFDWLWIFLFLFLFFVLCPSFELLKKEFVCSIKLSVMVSSRVINVTVGVESGHSNFCSS